MTSTSFPDIDGAASRRFFARRPAFALLAMTTLMACAQLPQEGARDGLRPIGSWAAGSSLNAQPRTWPGDQWWQTYGDQQLDALVREALQDSPSLQVAAARLRQAEAGVGIARSANAPQIGANANLNETKQSYNYLQPQSSLPQGWNDYGRLTLDFSWELDFWGRNRASLAAATSTLEAQAAELMQSRLLLASSVAAGYAELNRLHANRDTALKALEIRVKTAELIAKRHANGLETRGGLRDADARRAMAEGQLLAVDEQLALQRNRLAALLGAGPDRGQTITRPTLNLSSGFGLPSSLSADLLGRRPDVVAARLRAEAAAKRIDVAQAEFYPNVNLVGFIGVHSLGLDQLFKSGSDTGSVGPAISLPIFNGGRLKARYRASEAEYDTAVAQYNDTVTRALHEVADNAVSQKALGQRLRKAEEAVEAATEAHRVASNRYEGGLATYLEVLSAEDSLLGSLNARTNLQSLALSLDIDLQRSLGGGYQVTRQIAQR